MESNAGAVGGTKDGTLLYAATPDGIFLSGDSGATWRPTAPLVVPGLAATGLSVTVNNISLDPLDPSTLLVRPIWVCLARTVAARKVGDSAIWDWR